MWTVWQLVEQQPGVAHSHPSELEPLQLEYPELHEKPQDVPLQVSLALAGGDAHAVHDVPQVLVEVLLTQVPLQSW